MQELGLKAVRSTIKSLIRKICRKWGITRESIGIFAGARATMYFNGRYSSVSFEAIGALAENGTEE
jgi:hypothetical protein